MNYWVAGRTGFRFVELMIHVAIPGSKLCACSTRPARQGAYVHSVVALQLGKEGKSLPLHPSLARRNAAAETVPVSAPLAVRV